MGTEGARSTAKPGDRFAVRAWALATILAIVVTSVGVRDIAGRVVDALHLGGRPASEAALALGLEQRPGTGRFDDPAPGVVTNRAPEPAVGRPVDGRSISPAMQDLGAEETPAGWLGWQAASTALKESEPGSATTTWRPAAEGEGYELQYLHPADGWRRGYGDRADTRLTSPWLRVPEGDAPLAVELVAEGLIEPFYDRVEVEWLGAQGTWSTAGWHEGGAHLEQPLQFTFLDVVATETRVRLRLRFTSDEGVSTFGDEVLGETSGVTGLRVHDVRLVRGVATAGEALGTPRRDLQQQVPAEPRAVIWLSGGGINPYHQQFRDDSPRAFAHPSTYLAGYPTDAVAVWLSLDAPTYRAAVDRDRKVWAALERDRVYWFPGTRIVAARAMPFKSCNPYCILDREVDDDGPSGMAAGYGTAMAGRAAAGDFGGCPDCLVAIGQGWGAEALRWPAEQASWIDLQVPAWVTNDAWVGEDYRGVAQAAAAAAAAHPVFAPHVVAPVVNDDLSTAPGVVAVGVHDRGHVVVGAPGPHLAGPYCSNLRAAPASLNEVTADGAGGGSAVATVAGRAAQALLDVRREVGDLGVGVRDGALVVSEPRFQGPLVDGRLTVEEFRRTVLRSATGRPSPSPLGPACAEPGGPIGSTGIPWTAVPEGPASWPLLGYGVLDRGAHERTLASVLGTSPVPDRSDADRWFDLQGRS